MRFSLYSEMQLWDDKSPEQLYAEVTEQVVNADRLGYNAYAIVEHFFFPKFSVAPDPMSFFTQLAPKTQQIHFRTMLHVLPYHNPTVLASRVAAAEILTGGRYEFGVGRGHGWVPPKAGVRLPDVKELYDETFEVFFQALENERFSHSGRFFEIDDSHIVPPPPKKLPRVFLGGTSDSTYELAGQKGWAVAVPPLLPYEALRSQLDIYRESCAKNGNEPDIVWIHACYMDDDREVALRDAEQAMRRFIEGNCSPLAELGDHDQLKAAGYGFYTSGIMEQLAATPYDEMVAGDIVWVGTPEDVRERIAQTIDVCEGLSEIAITVNAGGFDHWQAIKTQEIFAHEVMPHFRGAGERSAVVQQV
ncbi:MAG TPA: LLM class flavin-dependent oxidoreductase [Candidatus Dormibacteraeota bacterium]|nr:LLM class flavin-dependent oxidoreductase [Candidatus Dormibacteraeota bacterium]